MNSKRLSSSTHLNFDTSSYFFFDLFRSHFQRQFMGGPNEFMRVLSALQNKFQQSYVPSDGCQKSCS